jgi:hypothetical protein
MFLRKLTDPHRGESHGSMETQAVPKKLNEKSIILDHSPIVPRPAGYPAFHPESSMGRKSVENLMTIGDGADSLIAER